MPGERTTSEGRYNDDDTISLREHMQRQLDVERNRTDDSLARVQELLERIVFDLAKRIDERFEVALHVNMARNAETDKRYAQRFDAQETAVKLALDRVDKEFHEHLRAAREETQAALAAADKAIAKSEVASEKRFESTNEFRAQLTDQAASFALREVVDQRFVDTRKLIEDLKITVTANLAQDKGSEVTMGKIYAAAGFVAAVVGVIVVFVGK